MKKIVFVILVIVGFGSYLDPFNFNVENSDIVYVVDGVFTSDQGPQQIFIGTAVTFGEKFNDPVLGASVRVFDDAGNSEEYLELQGGYYQKQGTDVIGETGKRYHVEIELQDGTRIHSVAAVMPKKVKIDSSYFRFEKNFLETSTGQQFFQDVISIYADASFRNLENDESIYLRWSLEEVYEYIEVLCCSLCPVHTCFVPLTPIIQERTIFSSDNYNAKTLQDVLIYSKGALDRQEFYHRHFFNVYQHSMTKEAFDYWTKVQKLIDQNGTVFDTPPATIRGNLFNPDNEDELILGYFEVSQIDSALTTVLRGDYVENIDPTQKCSFFAGTRNEFCCNCLAIPNAGLEKPDWIP